MTTTTNGWLSITLQTPFFYTGGNLLLEISQQNISAVTGITLNQFSVTGRNGRIYGNTANAVPGGADVATACFGFDAAPANCSGTPLTPTILTAAFPAATPLCSGATTLINALDPNLPINGMAYQWQSASASTGPWTNVTNGAGATTLAYTTGPVTANTYFRIAAICTNSSIASFSNPFLVPIGTPQPGPISGATTYCPGDPATYSVPALAGATYAWTLPPGWTGTSTSNSITVTPGPLSGTATISVTATSPCGPVSIAQTRNIVPGSAPGPPGTIAGNNNICAGTPQTYSVQPVGGASTYTWTFPAGWTVSGAANTNSVNVTTNATGGNVTVKANNGCGQSSITTLPVNIITTLANPGTITGNTAVCSGNLQTYSIAPVPGATSYVWSLPSGWSGTTTGTSIQAFPGLSGNLSVTAYVSCSISPVSSRAVTVTTTVTPAVAITTPAALLCQGTPIVFTATPANGGTTPIYQWKKNGVNVFSTGNTYTDNTLVTGDVVSVVMTSGAACASSATATSNAITAAITPAVVPGVSINTVPPIIICRGIPVTFTTTTNGGGQSPSYQWYKNGVAVGGATATTYTDAGLNNTDTLTISLASSAVCATMASVMSNKVGIRVNEVVTPVVSISVSPTDIPAPGQPLIFTATQSNGGATPDYQWQKNGVDIPFETGSSYTSSTLRAGDHISVKMISYDPCPDSAQVTSNEIVLKPSVGVGMVSSREGAVSLYPNPSGGRFTVSALWGASHAGREVQIDVVSAVGQSVYHMDLRPVSSSSNEWHAEVDLGQGVANGHYLLRLSTDDGMKTTLPFVLSR